MNNDSLEIHEYKNRQEYIDKQVERSRNKFSLCKVYFRDVIRYRHMLGWDQRKPNWKPNRILCLGVRSGGEVEIFRSVFYSPLFDLQAVQNRVSQVDTSVITEEKVKIARRWGVGRGQLDDGRVLGVEINPDADRPDVWVGSYDEMPKPFSNQFDILYSNSFDHSMDPQKTITEWKRVAAPGAYVIIAFSLGQDVSDHDPIGGLTFKTIADLWAAPVVFTSDSLNTNNYREICLKLP
jgi:SAM-dependent methyltransferase